MPQPKVSVIIPVYNTKPFIGRCVDSVQAQTYRNIEIIIVDDGSTDGSEKLVDELANSYENMVVAHQANQGPSAARCFGVLKATGDYVMFLDSDDTLPQDAIEYMVKICESNNLDAFYGGQNRIIDGNVHASSARDFEGVVDSDKMLQNVLNPFFLFLGCMCFSRREFWDENMFYKQRELPSEDLITNVKLTLKSNRIGIYNKPVYNYYFVSTSSTSTGDYFKYRYFKDLFRQLYDILAENGKTELTAGVLRMKEIMTLGFMIKDIDTNDEWYKQIMAYDVSGYPRKIKILHKLLRWPRLLKALVGANRWFKSLFNRVSGFN